MPLSLLLPLMPLMLLMPLMHKPTARDGAEICNESNNNNINCPTASRSTRSNSIHFSRSRFEFAVMNGLLAALSLCLSPIVAHKLASWLCQASPLMIGEARLIPHNTAPHCTLLAAAAAQQEAQFGFSTTRHYSSLRASKCDGNWPS